MLFKRRQELYYFSIKCTAKKPVLELALNVVLLKHADKYLHHDSSEPKPPAAYPEKPYRVKPIQGTKVKRPIHTTDTLLLQQWAEEQKLTDTSGKKIIGAFVFNVV